MDSLLKKAYWTLAAGGLGYVLLMLSMTNPTLQRNIIYVNKVNPLNFPWPIRQNLDDFEKYGFLNRQVTPFTLKTYDKETLAAYHLLPLDLYHQHEKSLFLQRDPDDQSYDSSTISTAYPVSLLVKNPNAKVIINCHGNAAHAFSAHRPPLLRALLSHSTPEQPVHVLTFDYRGFGHSTGSPTEEGLITDLLTLLNLLTSPPFSIPSSNIIIVSQSLGTAVATATSHTWLFNTTHPANPRESSSSPLSVNLVLMSSFTNVPDLLNTYQFHGVIPPILTPLKSYPAAKDWLLSTLVDTWNTSHRITDLVRHDWSQNDGHLQLSIMHASNDLDIPWREGMGNWRAAMRAAGVLAAPDIPGAHTATDEDEDEQEEKLHVIRMGESQGHILKEWRNNQGGDDIPAGGGKAEDDRMKMKKGDKLVSWERALYGAHNSVGLQEWSRLAMMRVLNRI